MYNILSPSRMKSSFNPLNIKTISIEMNIFILVYSIFPSFFSPTAKNVTKYNSNEST